MSGEMARGGDAPRCAALATDRSTGKHKASRKQLVPLVTARWRVAGGDLERTPSSRVLHAAHAAVVKTTRGCNKHRPAHILVGCTFETRFGGQTPKNAALKSKQQSRKKKINTNWNNRALHCTLRPAHAQNAPCCWISAFLSCCDVALCGWARRWRRPTQLRR